MGVTLSEFDFVKLSLLPVIRESCFKERKVPLGEYLYYWNVHFWLILYKKWLWAITVSEDRRCTCWFFLFELPFLRLVRERCFKGPKVSLDKYFYHWNVYFCYFCTKNGLWGITVSLLRVSRGNVLFDELFEKICNIGTFNRYVMLKGERGGGGGG